MLDFLWLFGCWGVQIRGHFGGFGMGMECNEGVVFGHPRGLVLELQKRTYTNHNVDIVCHSIYNI